MGSMVWPDGQTTLTKCMGSRFYLCRALRSINNALIEELDAYVENEKERADDT